MKDTPKIVEDYLFQKMMDRSGSERVLMAFSMLQTVRSVIFSSLPPHLSPSEKKVALFERLLASDFDRVTQEKIKRWIINSSSDMGSRSV